MKFFNTLLIRKKSVTNYEIYNHLKQYASWNTTLWGEDIAIRDIMNMMCDEFPNRGNISL
ncbi:hypothetical protein [Arcobacter arenosus]|uniref:hypothetical protein n=1 Tax=Arcobacter arenosus TaxID=2576037 RepID=UPI003BAACEE1